MRGPSFRRVTSAMRRVRVLRGTVPVRCPQVDGLAEVDLFAFLTYR